MDGPSSWSSKAFGMILHIVGSSPTLGWGIFYPQHCLFLKNIQSSAENISKQSDNHPPPEFAKLLM